MQKKLNTLILALVLLLPTILISQSRKIDSLRAIYYSNKPDSTRLQALNDLIWPLYANSVPDSGIKYGFIAIDLAKKLNDMPRLTVTYRRLAICYTNISDFKHGLEYHQLSLELAKKLNNTKDIGIALGNIGVVYLDIGDQTRALDYNLQSIKLKEQIKDYSSVQNNYYNVGLIYKEMGELDKAFEAMENSLKISKISNETNSLGATYNGMGIVLKEKKDYAKALYYYRKGVEANINNGNEFILSESYNNIGSLYQVMQQNDSALYYLQLSLKIATRINYKQGMANCLSSIAICYSALGQHKKAIEYAERSISIEDNLGSLEYCYNILSEEYGHIGNYKEALKYTKLRMKTNDSLTKINKTKDLIKLQMQYDYDKKMLADSIKFSEQEKVTMAKVEVANAKLEKEKTTRYALIVGLIGLIIFSYFIYTRFKLIKKQNVIIDIQKQETENQKVLIETKQKEIIDSINYAKRIQYALLASDNLLQNNLPEHFVMFQPKSVVSGDFYWATPTPEGFIYITADCTGHGVPGAFMSLLNISKLSQTINENKIVRPDLILNNVRTEILKALNPVGTVDESKDGMDAVLCKLNLKKMLLEYSSANNSFYIIRNGEILVCKADKMPVGKGHDDSVLFTYNEMALHKGDSIYTFTDGYADQFGGPKGKKFKYKQLEELLLSIHKEPLQKQSEILFQRFNDWKGDLEQVDDVCIIGVKV